MVLALLFPKLHTPNLHISIDNLFEHTHKPPKSPFYLREQVAHASLYVHFNINVQSSTRQKTEHIFVLHVRFLEGEKKKGGHRLFGVIYCGLFVWH
jgi:hypothetical protein